MPGACSFGLTIQGVTVRNFFRSHQYGFHEVSSFADGSVAEHDGRAWALSVVLHDGRAITASTTRHPSPTKWPWMPQSRDEFLRYHAERNEERVAEIRRAAERYGIAAMLTGKVQVAGRPPDSPGPAHGPVR